MSSFSAVSTPIFASKYSLESSRRDLHNALESNPPMKRNGRKEENGKIGRKQRRTTETTTKVTLIPLHRSQISKFQLKIVSLFCKIMIYGAWNYLKAHFCQKPQIVLGCIDADFCDQIRVGMKDLSAFENGNEKRGQEHGRKWKILESSWQIPHSPRAPWP